MAALVLADCSASWSLCCDRGCTVTVLLNSHSYSSDVMQAERKRYQSVWKLHHHLHSLPPSSHLIPPHPTSVPLIPPHPPSPFDQERTSSSPATSSSSSSKSRKPLREALQAPYASLREVVRNVAKAQEECQVGEESALIPEVLHLQVQY